MITPSTSNETEYVPFSITYTVAADPVVPPALPGADPIIQSVSITSSDGNNYTDEVIVTILNAQNFTVAGTLSDVFNRQMIYLDKNDVTGTVSRFKDIPADFNTLYHYRGATVNSITLTVNVTTDQGLITASIIVQNNYTVANANLVKYVKLGKF